jgi:16S rRNA (guanine527-N7)-methyltransferase
MVFTPASPHPPELWKQLGWQPSDHQLTLLQALQQQLRHWNSQLNLTRLVEDNDYWIAQVFDSLWPLLPLLQGPEAEAPLELIDVGTGGGFPGLAAAIALPQARLTLVDSVGRKVEAVRAMAQALGLEHRVQVRCERVERSGQSKQCRGRFHWALARAVASAPVVAEYLVPLLAPEGRALLYRGQWSDADQAALAEGLVATFDLFEASPDELRFSGNDLVLLLDRLQDPGNLGTLMRTALASLSRRSRRTSRSASTWRRAHQASRAAGRSPPAEASPCSTSTA